MSSRGRKAAGKRSLSANLNRSADKRGLSGEARTRYIVGGAYNAEKRHAARLAAKKAATAKTPAATASRAKAKAKSAYLKDGRKRLVLVVRKNAAASATRAHDVYSVYEEGKKEPYTSAIFRSRKDATEHARVEANMQNSPRGIEIQRRML